MIKAKKQFGQNFLKDKSILQKIIQSKPFDDMQVVEIGPGLGDLTRCLLQCGTVIAYEIDSELSAHLGKVFAEDISSGALRIAEGDVLRFWKDSGCLYHSPYQLIANLPYNVATPIIEKALFDNNCMAMVIMIQKEVALKLIAPAKSKEFCALSVLAQSVARLNIITDVYPEAFEPQPKVTSSVIVLHKNGNWIDNDQVKGLFTDQKMLDGFLEYLLRAFSAPRKTIWKNLKPFYVKSALDHLSSSLNLSTTIRPHEIDTTTHHHIFKKLYS